MSKAFELAAHLEGWALNYKDREAAAELRRLAAEVESLKLAMRELVISDDSGDLDKTHIEACRKLLENHHG
jgi:hypothetical protein